MMMMNKIVNVWLNKHAVRKHIRLKRQNKYSNQASSKQKKQSSILKQHTLVLSIKRLSI